MIDNAILQQHSDVEDTSDPEDLDDDAEDSDADAKYQEKVSQLLGESPHSQNFSPVNKQEGVYDYEKEVDLELASQRRNHHNENIIRSKEYLKRKNEIECMNHDRPMKAGEKIKLQKNFHLHKIDSQGGHLAVANHLEKEEFEAWATGGNRPRTTGLKRCQMKENK